MTRRELRVPVRYYLRLAEVLARRGVDIAQVIRELGMPASLLTEAERERVLGRFVRLEDARSRPGFGLGLSLANAVVRLHRGTLRLSDNGPGLRVELAFPAQLPGDAAEARDGAAEPIPASAAGAPGGSISRGP